MSLSFDLRKWPIAVCRAYGHSSDDDLRAYLAKLGQLLRRKERHVLIVDATDGKSLRGTHRQMVADWNKTNAEELKKYRAGLCLVTPSPVLRGTITAVYWLFPPPFPYKAADTLGAAHVWAEDQLTEKV